jgi:hypothetical protein
MRDISSENEIISYTEMCARENSSLQRGMNYKCSGNYSIILMSVRRNAPYNDTIIDHGMTLIYEGHDIPKTTGVNDPKIFDQPENFPSGRLTQNGLFHKAACEFKSGRRPAEHVRVYEKIMTGIWAYNGLFNLIDSWKENINNRHVFKFKLTLIEKEISDKQLFFESSSSRIIPSPVKLEVWKRDQGRCAICGATTELHFDHIVPYSKGGTSISACNIQLLCARHNIAKHNKIE